MSSVLRRELGITNILVVYPGVDATKFISKCRDDGKTLLYISRIDPCKNQLFLLNLLSKILKDRKVKLIIAGYVSHKWYLKRIKKRILELGIKKNVDIYTNISEQMLRALYSNTTIYLHPAKYESFGLTILEAMASGKPVIAHRSGGPRELIINGVTGFLVRDDPDSWIKLINLLLDKKEIRDRIAKNAQLKVIQKFLWNRTIERLESLIKIANANI